VILFDQDRNWSLVRRSLPARQNAREGWGTRRFFLVPLVMLGIGAIFGAIAAVFLMTATFLRSRQLGSGKSPNRL
jgi:hypothetical protein